MKRVTNSIWMDISAGHHSMSATGVLRKQAVAVRSILLSAPCLHEWKPSDFAGELASALRLELKRLDRELEAMKPAKKTKRRTQ